MKNTYFETFFCYFSRFLALVGDLPTLERTLLENGLFPVKETLRVVGTPISLTISILHFTPDISFIPWDFKKSDKTARPWILTLTDQMELWWHIYIFYNLNLIAEGISILCMSLFYTKWRKDNFFDKLWAILFDTLFFSTHFRSIFFRHFVFFWKITSLENITEFQN